MIRNCSRPWIRACPVIRGSTALRLPTGGFADGLSPAPRSETYLAHFVEYGMSIDDLDLYQIMRATGQIESVLGLGWG
jgi:hypothetical protein